MSQSKNGKHENTKHPQITKIFVHSAYSKWIKSSLDLFSMTRSPDDLMIQYESGLMTQSKNGDYSLSAHDTNIHLDLSVTGTLTYGPPSAITCASARVSV
jgi:hypothetical protein